MKKSIYVLFLSLLVCMSCSKDELIEEQQTLDLTTDISAARGPEAKIMVCHYAKSDNTWESLEVNENALNSHLKHGDAVDMDGDGYFNKDNGCSETDCDDANAAVNPGATEICGSGVDENCNGEVDESCITTVELNGLTWTAENLDIEIPGSVCYDNDPNNCATYGRLYNFQEAQTACAALGANWRVPTKSEWDAMILSFGGLGAAPGSAYDELMNGGTSGLNILLGGVQSVTFQDIGIRGRYWSSTETNSSFAWQYQFILNIEFVGISDNEKTTRRSCRCVMD